MDTLYHYCSSQSFHSMIQSRAFWLSSLTLSNDSMEGKYIALAMGRIASREGVDEVTRGKLIESLSILEEMFDGLGFCLSAEGDLLSQWRGYANDGMGFSIGFSLPYLKSVLELNSLALDAPVTLDEVKYSKKEHEDAVEPTYRRVKKFIDDGAFKSYTAAMLLTPGGPTERRRAINEIQAAYSNLQLGLMPLLYRLFMLKGDAFSEEKEWRLFTFRLRNGQSPCQFRPSSDRIVPYRVFKIEESRNPQINKVVLGPKNKTPIDVARAFLKSSGFGDVEVTRSRASYQ